MFRFNHDKIYYGITEQKRKKYEKQVRKLVRENFSNPELLRQILKAFGCRVVYRINKYNTKIWKCKGLISNYNELRHVKEDIVPETLRFFNSLYCKAFTNQGFDLPYYLKDNCATSIYNIKSNLTRNRTLLFEEGIGISLQTLKNMCEQIGITTNDVNEYNSLLLRYLIKIKVGY